MLQRFTALRNAACAAVIVCATFAQAQSPHLTSGFYGDHTLQIVVAPDGSFTGSFFDESGVGGVNTCRFLLHSDGQYAKRGEGYRVMTWWPTTQLDGGTDDEAIYGVLRFSPKGLTLQLPRHAHDGCGDVNHTLGVGWPIELKRISQSSLWRELRLVQAKKLFLRSLPDASSEPSQELYQGDAVIIVAKRGTWQHVYFYSYVSDRTLSGWVPDADLLAPVAPTQQAPPKKKGTEKPGEPATPDADPAQPASIRRPLPSLR
jgi:hypothetical protein